MDYKQTIAMLTWINQVDPRVMLNEASVDVWAYSLRSVDPSVAKQAVLEHYKQHEGIAASPGAISKRATNIRASREAGQRAIEAGRNQWPILLSENAVDVAGCHSADAGVLENYRIVIHQKRRIE